MWSYFVFRAPPRFHSKGWDVQISYKLRSMGNLENEVSGWVSVLLLRKRPRWAKLGSRQFNWKYLDVPGCPTPFQVADISSKKSDYQYDWNWMILDNGLQSNQRSLKKISRRISEWRIVYWEVLCKVPDRWHSGVVDRDGASMTDLQMKSCFSRVC